MIEIIFFDHLISKPLCLLLYIVFYKKKKKMSVFVAWKTYQMAFILQSRTQNASSLFGYGCQPYFLASVVCFTFPFIFIMYKTIILLLFPCFIFDDIYFSHRVRGIVFNFILLFYLMLSTYFNFIPIPFYYSRIFGVFRRSESVGSDVW